MGHNILIWEKWANKIHVRKVNVYNNNVYYTIIVNDCNRAMFAWNLASILFWMSKSLFGYLLMIWGVRTTTILNIIYKLIKFCDWIIYSLRFQMSKSNIWLTYGWYYDCLFILTIYCYCYPHIIYKSLKLLLYILIILFYWKGKFDISKLFPILTIYHFYYFIYLTFLFFYCPLDINKN